jgi:hypothetical protein
MEAGTLQKVLHHRSGPFKTVKSVKAQQTGHEPVLQHRKERQGFCPCKQFSGTAITWQP